MELALAGLINVLTVIGYFVVAVLGIYFLFFLTMICMAIYLWAKGD